MCIAKRGEMFDLAFHRQVQPLVQRAELVEILVQRSNRIADLEQRQRLARRVLQRIPRRPPWFRRQRRWPSSSHRATRR